MSKMEKRYRNKIIIIIIIIITFAPRAAGAGAAAPLLAAGAPRPTAAPVKFYTLIKCSY